MISEKNIMKKDIHLKYHPKSKITCACGNTFNVGSTVEEMQVEICSNCHPFYTGKQKFIDTRGRVDRFKRIVEKAAQSKKKVTSKTEKRRLKATKKEK